MKFSARTWLTIGILYIGYIIYGTLLPFNFSLSLEILRDSIGNIEWSQRYGRQIYSLRNVDAIVNFLLFVPLGIIIFNRQYALDNQQHHRYNIFKTTVYGLLLSLIIEFAQLFIETRTTSLIDIIMNTAGCFSGAVIAVIVPGILSSSIRNKISHWIKRLPDVIILIPIIFIGLVLTEGITSFFLTSEKVGNNLFEWRYIIEPVWIWQILCVYIPVGIFSMRVIQKSMRNISLPIIHLCSFIVAIAIAGSIELIKLIIYGNTPPDIHIIFGISGVLIGIAISEILKTDKDNLSIKDRRQTIMILFGIFLFLESLIFYKFAYPFEFSLEKSYVFDQLVFLFLSVYSFIPFAGFEKLLIFSLQSIILFIPIGIVVQEIELYLRFKNNSTVILSLSFFLVILPIILQILNQHQTAFLYELPTNTIGLFMGYFLWYGFRKNNTHNLKTKQNLRNKSEKN